MITYYEEKIERSEEVYDRMCEKGYSDTSIESYNDKIALMQEELDYLQEAYDALSNIDEE